MVLHVRRNRGIDPLHGGNQATAFFVGWAVEETGDIGQNDQ